MFNMIEVKKVIDLVGFEYKEEESYKVDGKGMLERLVEICGSYFEDNIWGDIESLVGISEFDRWGEIYLN